MGSAVDALLALRPDGLQLTPGNQPTPGISERLGALTARTHHGFSAHAWKQTVWRADGTCAVDSDSVHPPVSTHPAADTWAPDATMPVLETMYPGNRLGTGAELDHVMSLGLPLAVDVSHVFMQRCAGAIGEATWKRLQDYEHVAEVHVSANAGRSDSHFPLTADTFGLPWALEKLRAGTPVILESYFHRLSHDARRAQVALFDGART